jgi:hypothetical protein
MKYYLIGLLCTLFCFSSQTFAQEKEYQVACVGFYNLENLFDTEDDPEKRDGDFTPEGKRLWTEDLYAEKLDNMAKVVAELGTELTPDGIAILGVSEIENRKVLEDLVAEEKLKNRDYQIVHFDSPDKRGIDVGLLYQAKYYEVTNSKAIPLMIYDDNEERIFTRDILLVSGNFQGEPLHILVNHWPSRRGGEKRSAPLRNAGADRCKLVIDSLRKIDANAKIMLMGDLNDDPVSPSVKKHLAAKSDVKKLKKGDLFNPMYKYYKKGIGTLAYRDAWSLFDQIIMTESLTNKKQTGFQYYRTDIYNKKYLVQKTGRYKGYPYRTFSGDTYQGGYSDHYPVFVYLIKEK